MTSVTGTLSKNLLKLSGTSQEVVDFNHKLSLFSQFLDTIQTKDAAELADLLSAASLENMTSKSVSKGIEGELFVEKFIDSHLRLNPDWHITNISKDGAFNSDLELVYKNLHCVIEVKNIKTKLSESNIKKFKEEYILSESKQYNSGIFVSLNSDYSANTKVFDFCIQEIDGRFVIYLSNVRESPDKLIFAMEVLNQIISISYDKDTKTILDLLNKQVKNYGILMSNVNKMTATTKEMKQNLTMFKEEINSYLSSL